MKIELIENYPAEVKDYVNEYNMGVETKDINVVGTAINALVQLLFSPNEMNRQAALHALDQVGNVQPGFLKSAVKTLLIRFKGTDESKKAFAAAALEGIFIGKKAEKLIDDVAVVEELRSQQTQKIQQQAEVKQREEAVVREIRQTGLDLSVVNAFPEMKAIGQYYNDSLLNKNTNQALEALQNLVRSLIQVHKIDKSRFVPGCILLGQTAAKQNRQAFFKDVVTDILKFYMKGNKDEKLAALELIESIFKDIVDLIPTDIAGMIQGDIQRRQQERQAARTQTVEKAAIIGKLKIPLNVGWDASIQKMAEDYNNAVTSGNEKAVKGIAGPLEKALMSSDARISKNAIDVLGILLAKNYEIVKNIIFNLTARHDDPKNIAILGTVIDDIEKLKLAEPSIITAIRVAKKERDAELLKLQQEKQQEYEKLQKITIKFEGDWQKEIINFIEKLNEQILKKDMKSAQKTVNNELKKIIYAKDNEIRKTGQIVFARIVEKYPELVDDLAKDLITLFLSDHEQRNLAVDLFGHLLDMGLAENYFKDRSPELMQRLPNDWANRKQEIENLELQTKWDAIKQDVTQLRINDNWKSNIQKIARDYNNAIKIKDMKTVMEAVRRFVEIFMKERNEELQDNANQVLGLIAKQNIELIQPTIDLFLQLIEGKDKDKKTRAIKGLGEVTRQRPGWAYFGIEKLIYLIETDPDEDFRMKAILEINRIAEKDPVMLIEYLAQITNALVKDPNKHVKRLTALTLGSMAPAIATVTPEEQQKVISALTDALHDEYILVRKFADNALAAIRAAMRKAEGQ